MGSLDDVKAAVEAIKPVESETPQADESLPFWVVLVDPCATPPHAKFHSGYQTPESAEQWAAKLQTDGEKVVADENAMREWLNSKPERKHLEPLPMIQAAPSYHAIPRPAGGKL